MKPIDVFYHLYIPEDWKHALWADIFDQQMQTVVKSRLHNVASRFYVSITMPMHWTSSGAMTFRDREDQPCTFSRCVIDYIETRYKFAKVVDVRDTSEKNFYEGITLKHVWDHCQINDSYILYFHSKGISNISPTGTTSNWRKVLDYLLIETWDQCVPHLHCYDLVAVEDKITCGLVTSGNYWWGTSDYIRSLPNPLEVRSYFTDYKASERYGYERWIKVNYPRTCVRFNTAVNHYEQNLYLEDVVKIDKSLQ